MSLFGEPVQAQIKMLKENIEMLRESVGNLIKCERNQIKINESLRQRIKILEKEE